MYSDFRKGFMQTRTVDNASASTSTAVTPVKLRLNKDNLTSAHIINFAASQAFSADPTGSDVRRALDSIVLELNGGPKAGTTLSLGGFLAYELSRFTENQPSPVVSLPSGGTGGTATATWALDLHHVMDSARNDFQTALQTGLYDSIDLTLNLSTTANQIFTGGTASGAVSYVISADAHDFPVFPVQPNIAMVASAQQIVGGFNKSASGAGDGDDVLLISGSNKTRFIGIEARDGSNVLSDSVVGDIEIQAGNWIYKTNFAKVQQQNVHSRGYDQTGFAFLDFGDDPMGWLPLENVKDARLKWKALAACTVKFAQVRMEMI
jgi:hypothetical protein